MLRSSLNKFYDNEVVKDKNVIRIDDFVLVFVFLCSTIYICYTEKYPAKTSLGAVNWRKKVRRKTPL